MGAVDVRLQQSREASEEPYCFGTCGRRLGRVSPNVRAVSPDLISSMAQTMEPADGVPYAATIQ